MKVCYVCGKKRALLYHHLDGSPSNNESSNLVVLCRGCHAAAHKTFGSNPTTLAGLDSLREERIARGSRLRYLVHSELTAMGKTRHVLEHWPTVAARFEEVCGYKETYDRHDLIQFLNWERHQGFTENSIEQHLKAIKVVARVQAWDWPKLPMRRVNPDDIKRTIFSKDEVISLIQMGRQLLDGRDLSYLALSTTYGVRREEMSKLKPGDIGNDTITIKTAKGGRMTTHLIPDKIKPSLDFFIPYSPDYLSHLFLRMLRTVGIKVGAGYGWHSIRRALATELLLSEMSALNILRFMRWSDASTKSDFGMLAIYAKKDQARIDEEIFRIHPFLPYWG